MKIKNWSKFQHFKDRKPPWVKLYRDVLDDMEWYELDPLASKVLIMCWLIASEDEGRLPNIKTLAFRLRMTEKQTFDCINKLEHWLEQDDIVLISEQYQLDTPETETETETKKETETEKETKTKIKATVVATPVGVSESVWNDFVALRKSKKAVLTNTALEGLQREAAKANLTLQKVLEICCERGWASFKSDWIAGQAFRTDSQGQIMRMNPRDVANVTTPTPANHDAALRKIEDDRKKAVPPSLETLAKLAELRKNVKES